jgi:L-alanine-DL-glutamate epimerase-like enolase superfamily enzyme
MRGGGHEGQGEDVGYDGDDQAALQRAGAVQPLAGEWTLGSFCEHLEALDLWPEPDRHAASRDYRIWGYESAALDLALRQSGTSLAAHLGREPRPVSFVCSLRLNDPGDPPDVGRVTRLLERYPTLRFKLDPTPDWDERIVATLQETGAVDSVDLKGLYEGTVVDVAPDAAFYARIAEAFPGAWIEDPKLTAETDAALAAHRPRITWDANIHSVEDVDALPFPPQIVNVKPSRFGPLRRLFHMYDTCEQREIGMYGGGQFELGPGRGQIQYLASIFHPDGPNDVAPTGYNEREPPDGLPASPLAVAAHRIGLRWG